MRCFNRRGLVPGIHIQKYFPDPKISSRLVATIFNSRLAREYKKELEEHGWVGSYLLGVLYDSMGDKKKSEECFKFALKYMPRQKPHNAEKYDFFVEYSYLVMRKKLGKI